MYAPRILFFISLGVLSFSFSPILVRYAAEAPGLAVAVWRTGLAVLFLAPFAFTKAHRTAWRQFPARTWLWTLGAGILLGLHFVTFITSLYHTSVASVTVIFASNPLFLALLGALLLRERLPGRAWWAIVIAFAGTSLIAWSNVSGPPGGNVAWGNMVALVAAVLHAAYLLVGRVVRQGVSWLAYVFPLYTVAALTTLVVALLDGVALTGYPWPIYALCGLMALGPQILGHGSFNYAVKYVKAAWLGLLSLLEPIGASLLAYLLFAERPSALAGVGMVVVLMAVAWALYGQRSVQE